MSIDQSPETTSGEAETTVDPEAPFGRRKDGTPYKRDPSAFAHLRGRPFGSLNGTGAKAPAKRDTPAAKGKRPSVATPLRHDAAGYGAKAAKAFKAVGRYLMKGAPVAGALVAIRAEPLGNAWGEVAVEYPKLGRVIDRMSKGSVLSEAVGGTATLVMMIAHTQGLTKGMWFDEILSDAVTEYLEEFARSPEMEKLHERYNTAMEARAQAYAEAAARAAQNGD